MSDHEDLQDTAAPLEASAQGEDAATAAGEDAASVAGEATGGTQSRPSVRGIHPELVCQCPECETEHVELQWFNVDEARKTKGDAMLFCARSSRKYFVPIIELNTWLSQHGGPRKGRRGDA
jgi:hypothetical protein